MKPLRFALPARYRGDKGIQNDPSVILFDDFESYTDPSQLKTKWTGAGRLANLRIATEPSQFFAGRKSLEMKLPISTSETINRAAKKLDPEQTRIYFRAYMKWDPGYSVTTSGHNGLRIAAHDPGGAGVSPPRNGTGFFLFTLQNTAGRTYLPREHQPGYSEFYVYWPKQRSKFGDHWYPDGRVSPGGTADWLLYPNQYPDFNAMPNWQPERGTWYCIESMVKANTVGKRDGEAAFWVNGVLKARFPNLFLRSINSLKIDDVELRQHALHSERVNKKWYDNVVVAKQYIGPRTAASAISSETTTATARFQNFSSRFLIQNGDKVGITGFIIEGSEPTNLLIRGLGPSLAKLGITGVMQNPMLELYDSSGSLIAWNDDWKNTQQVAITATGVEPANDSESAVLATLEPGSYTVVQASATGGTGEGLVEIYDLDTVSASTPINMSTRGLVQPGIGLIAGCSVNDGSGSSDVLLRALGSSLTAQGVNGALADPILTLYDSNGNLIAANDNWKDSQQEAIENTALPPADDFDAAIFTVLKAGSSYTAVVTSKNSNHGIALLDINTLDPTNYSRHEERGSGSPQSPHRKRAGDQGIGEGRR